MILRKGNALVNAPVSHNPAAVKRVWLHNGEIPPLTQLSRATIPAGITCPVHTHHDMWEVFIVESGFARLTVQGTPHHLAPDDCLVVEPGEPHELTNSGPSPLHILTIGGLPPNTAECF